MKRIPLIVALLVLVSCRAAAWWLIGPAPARAELVLYGDVDLRQVELAFNNSERIAAVSGAGGRPRKARPSPGALGYQPAGTAGRAGRGNRRGTASGRRKTAQRQPSAGDREARANVESAAADATNARGQYERRKTLAANAIVSQQDLENAKAALDVAEAKLAVNQKALDLAIAGPRKEDIGQAEAELRGRRGAGGFPAPGARGCPARRPGRCRRPYAPYGAGRDGVAAKAGVLAGGHRSEMGPRLCRRAGSRQAAARE